MRSATVASLPPLRSGLWALLGLLAAAYALWTAAYVQEATYLSISRQPQPEYSGDSSSLWGGRTTERDRPERALFDNDSYYWIRYAQQMVHWHTPRIRYTLLDNTPTGREVHWSSGYAWLLVAAGGVQAMLSGRGWVETIPDAAVWANTVFFFSVLCGLCWAVTRRAGGLVAGITVFTLSCLPGISWAFAYGRPGHHCIHSLAALGGITCLFLGGLGWVRAGTEPAGTGGWQLAPLAYSQARRWFVAAGVFAGVGLWVGATLQAVVLVAIGIGGFLASAVPVSKDSRGSTVGWDGRLWLWWAGAGVACSFGFFLIEYFPRHIFAMRLEVNHPVYACSLLGGGMVLSRGRDFWTAEGWRKSWSFFLIAGGLAAVAPAAVLLGPTEWHSLRDPYMRRLHDGIMNFQPLLSLPGADWKIRLLREFGFIPLIGLPVFIWALARRREDTGLLAGFAFLIPPALILGAWTFHQVRWSNLLTPVFALMVVAISWWVAAGWKGGWSRWLRLAVLVAMLAPTWIYWAASLSDVRRAREVRAPDAMLARAMATRDVALALRRYSKIMDVRVMSAPTETPSLHYFGGVPGTGSLYWENVKGVRDAADFYGDFGEADALRIVRERGINFILAQEDPGMAFDMCWVKRGTREDADVRRTMAYRLSAPGQDLPRWLEPVPFYSSPAAQLFRMRLYRVRLEGDILQAPIGG